MQSSEPVVESQHRRRVEAVARVCFASTAAVVICGVAIQQHVVVDVIGQNASAGDRLAATLSYFTVDANAIVGLTTILLAIRLRHSSIAFRVLRLTGLASITTVGVVYHALLADEVHFTGWSLIGDQMLHTAVPALTVSGWLLFGPRGSASWREVGLALLFPVGWLAFVLLRGAVVGWYPYPFLGAADLGYGQVMLHVLRFAVLYILIAAAATATDRWLTR